MYVFTKSVLYVSSYHGIDMEKYPKHPAWGLDISGWRLGQLNINHL